MIAAATAQNDLTSVVIFGIAFLVSFTLCHFTSRKP
jgi:hypothetical protein